jgi:hypothetical protein
LLHWNNAIVAGSLIAMNDDWVLANQLITFLSNDESPPVILQIDQK